MALFNRSGKVAAEDIAAVRAASEAQQNVGEIRDAIAALRRPTSVEAVRAAIEALQKPETVAGFRTAQEALEAKRAQLERLRSKLAEASAGVPNPERVLELEASGTWPSGLDEAQRQISAIEKMIGMAESGLERAELERDRELIKARLALRDARLKWITQLLHHHEALLWEVLASGREIDTLVLQSIEEGIPIGINSTSQYWTIGSPTYPHVRDEEQIRTWRRHRSIAPRG